MLSFFFFFFTDTATTEIYTLSLHDALPISPVADDGARPSPRAPAPGPPGVGRWRASARRLRSEEHTSELQSRFDLVCRLLLEKKKNTRCQRLSRPDSIFQARPRHDVRYSRY